MKDKKRPAPLALLPALTPTRSRPHISSQKDSPEVEGDEDGRQQLPTPASLFAAPTLVSSPAPGHPHTPGRNIYRGIANLISSSEVSLGAVGSTPRSAGARHTPSQSVPALGAAWEEPNVVRKTGVAPASVPTPPPSGRVAGKMAAPELDWPSLDEAYYPEQHAEPPASGSPQGTSKPASGSPHTPGGPRARPSPGSCGGGLGGTENVDEARERAKREAAERLSASPAVLAAVSRLVAACGQMSASVQRPFLTVCDAAMGVSGLGVAGLKESRADGLRWWIVSSAGVFALVGGGAYTGDFARGGAEGFAC